MSAELVNWPRSQHFSRKENDGPKSETGTESDANKSEGGEIGLKGLRGTWEYTASEKSIFPNDDGATIIIRSFSFRLCGVVTSGRLVWWIIDDPVRVSENFRGQREGRTDDGPEIGLGAKVYD